MPWDIEIVSGDFDSLRAPGIVPVIAFVSMDDKEIGFMGGGGISERWHRWQLQRQSHAILIDGFSDGGGVDVGDPSLGHTQWKDDHLRRQWCGVGLRLVRRPGVYERAVDRHVRWTPKSPVTWTNTVAGAAARRTT